MKILTSSKPKIFGKHTHEILVDDEDYEYLRKFNWNFGSGYPKITKNREQIYLARLLMSPIPLGMEVDHIDRNPLNCQKSNLRLATGSQQCANRGKWGGTFSKYKGVSFHKSSNLWVARIVKNKKWRSLGYFRSEIKAAKAYNKAALELFSEFACLNLFAPERNFD